MPLARMESNARGIQSIQWEYRGMGLFKWAFINAIDVFAVKGGDPVRSSTAVHASAYSSEAADGAWPRSTSGDTYGREASTCVGLPARSPAIERSMPKSESIAPPSENGSATRMFVGLTSQCTIPLTCALSNAPATW